jgi:hypothetical protein
MGQGFGDGIAKAIAAMLAVVFVVGVLGGALLMWALS